MKFKIEVDIDWISDDAGVDQTIKDALVEKVIEKINESSVEDIAERAQKAMTDRANQIVDSAYEHLLGKTISVTDEWGKVIKEYSSAEEMIKQRFDHFMSERVDSNGSKSNYGDGTRLDYIVKKQLEKITKEFTEKAVKEVAEKIKVTLNDSLKEKLGGRLIDMMEIDKMIAKQLKA
jgi:hypothetical protein